MLGMSNYSRYPLEKQNVTDDTLALCRSRLPDGQNLQWWNEDNMKRPGAKQFFCTNLVAGAFGNLRDQFSRFGGKKTIQVPQKYMKISYIGMEMRLISQFSCFLIKSSSMA